MELREIKRVDPFDTQCLLSPSEVLPVGTHRIQIQTRANFLLSSLFLASVPQGATVEARYFQTTSGTLKTERQDLQTHGVFDELFAFPTTNTISVSEIHDKVVLEVVITGQPVAVGVYVTGLPGSGSKLDRVAVADNQTFVEANDLAFALSALDRINNRHVLLSANSAGELAVTSSSNEAMFVESGSQAIDALQTEVVIALAVPVGQSWKILSGKVWSETDMIFDLEVNGQLVSRCETSFEARSVSLADSSLSVDQGGIIEVKAKSKSWTNSTCEAKAFLYLREVDA